MDFRELRDNGANSPSVADAEWGDLTAIALGCLDRAQTATYFQERVLRAKS